MRNYKKNNAWNIGRLVDESLVPTKQQTSKLYCRLLDFKAQRKPQILVKVHSKLMLGLDLAIEKKKVRWSK